MEHVAYNIACNDKEKYVKLKLPNGFKESLDVKGLRAPILYLDVKNENIMIYYQDSLLGIMFWGIALILLFWLFIPNLFRKESRKELWNDIKEEFFPRKYLTSSQNFNIPRDYDEQFEEIMKYNNLEEYLI